MTHRTPRVSDEIPTASMADIAFLLIVFFMLTATFTASQGLDYGLPKDDEKLVDIDPVESVLVEVQSNGDLLVDSRALPIGELLAYLHPRLQQNPGKPVILKTDPLAPYGSMVDVLDELRQGKDRLGLEDEITVAIPTQREQTQFWL